MTTGDSRFELERAITQNELELHYQPIFDISGDALRGVEALVRWKHPQKGLVSPQAFLPTAEREGLMHALTAWVLREALLQASVWRKDGLSLNMSVNIAASDLRDQRFVRLLDRTLRLTAGGSAFSAEVRADETADASTAGLRELGSRHIPIALDDVTSVKQLDGAATWPLDTVKLGREIIGHALDDARAADMARAIARFAAERGIGVVAVGIESKAMLGFARALGCVGAQGYLLARPMASQALRRWAQAGV
ncbi:MAG TPA: EAL domain-containing protein [Candidatus Limnocylindria bacterium]|nr:EAL domain-containing protein [Candidatus Limnocylindria bacterium]